MGAPDRIRRCFSQQLSQADKLLNRIKCQIEFGRAINDGRFSEALNEAELALQKGGKTSSLDALKSVVAQVEAALQPIAEEAKNFTIHCVGHGHIDMNWMWSWPETCATTHDTFASVLSLMEQYPELTYSQSQASVYALVEKYHPAMFEQIKRRVKEGRWEVAAVHWVEGDKNLASGESLAHHLLYTRRYVQEKFGLTPEDCQLDWEPDTFGHCNTLPGILRQGGVKYYYCCRPGGGQEHLRVGEERPPVFWWQSPDGSRVLVNKETTWYNSYVEIGANYALPAADFWKKTGLKDWLNVYGIGNHGGGPTREEIDYFIETRDWPCWPQVIFGTAQGWFRKIEPLCGKMPVIDHELNFEFTGCYTSQSAIKKANRYGENYCVEAETLEAIRCSVLGIGSSAGAKAEHPTPNTQHLLRDAWINVLFNQFHDILPGSGVAATRNHALGLFQETGTITGAIKRNALQEITKDLNTAALIPDTPEGRYERELIEQGRANTPFEAGAGQGAGESGFSRSSGGGNRFRPIVLFNTCAWPRSEMVQVSLYDLEKDIPDDRIVALDEEGNAYPTLNVTGAIGGTHDWGHRRTDLLFYAKDIPALGYKTFLFCEGEAPVAEIVSALSETHFETLHMRVQLEKFTSGIRGFVLKTNGASINTGVETIGEWQDVVEWPTGMSAWLLGGNRGLKREKTRAREPLQTSKFRTIGAYRNEATSLSSGGSFAMVATNAMKKSSSLSSVELTTMISAAEPRVDFVAAVDWREIGTSDAGIPGLQIDFDTFTADEATFETPFGTVNRTWGHGNEVPSLRFAHVFGGQGYEKRKDLARPLSGMTLLQDSKYGHATAYSALHLRVLRSTYDPDHAPEVGKSTMRYALVFHDTEPTKAELVRLGAAFNHPLIVLPTTLKSGDKPLSHTFAEVKTESVVLSTIKRAEDGDGLILRLVNYSNEEACAEVELSRELTGHYSKATVVDLMERPVDGAATLTGPNLRVTVAANSFVTVALTS